MTGIHPRVEAVDLLKKLLHLLKGFDRNKLISELNVEAGIQRRTIVRWFDTVGSINQPQRDKIVKYLLDHHQISFPFPWFGCSFEQMKAEYEESKLAPDPKIVARARTAATPLAPAPGPYRLYTDLVGVSPLSSSHVKLLCGKYILYRYSFSDRGEIVSELASITPIDDSDTELAVTMHCHPASDQSETRNPESETESETQVKTEKFTGKLFRLGWMFYMICSFNEDRRMRYLHFPVLLVGREEHYGIVTGFSQNLGEPVAARIFARRISPDPALNREDFARVKRGFPNKKGGLEIPPGILSLIDNRIDNSNSSILTVDQRLVSKMPRDT
jgi:hypothetical protein